MTLEISTKANMWCKMRSVLLFPHKHGNRENKGTRCSENYLLPEGKK